MLHVYLILDMDLTGIEIPTHMGGIVHLLRCVLLKYHGL